jgi:hypothetical protein
LKTIDLKWYSAGAGMTDRKERVSGKASRGMKNILMPAT